MKRVIEVIDSLKRNPDVKIVDDIIYVKSSKDPSFNGKIGNKTLAKLDFLSKNGFTVIRNNSVQHSTPEPILVAEPQQQETIKIRPRIKLKQI